MATGVGKAMKQGFAAMLKQGGSVVRVSSPTRDADEPALEVVGLQSHAAGDPQSTVFKFAERIDEIREGSILQIDGSKDFWQVVDTEDHITAGTLIYFEVRVKKAPRSGA